MYYIFWGGAVSFLFSLWPLTNLSGPCISPGHQTRIYLMDPAAWPAHPPCYVFDAFRLGGQGWARLRFPASAESCDVPAAAEDDDDDSDDNIDELHCLCNKMQSSVSMVHANKLYLSAVTLSPWQRRQSTGSDATCHHLCLHLGAQSRLSSQNKLCFWMRKSSQDNWGCSSAWDVIAIEHYSVVFPSDLRSGTFDQSSNQWCYHYRCTHTQTSLYILSRLPVLSCLLKGHQQALRGESTKVITTSLCEAERESKLEKLRDRYHRWSTANPMPACGLSGLPDAKRRWVPQDKLSRGSVRSWMVPHMKIHSYDFGI